MINFHCTIIPVVVLDSVITHTSAWFLDREIHQLVICSDGKRVWFGSHMYVTLEPIQRGGG